LRSILPQPDVSLNRAAPQFYARHDITPADGQRESSSSTDLAGFNSISFFKRQSVFWLPPTCMLRSLISHSVRRIYAKVALQVRLRRLPHESVTAPFGSSCFLWLPNRRQGEAET
jgi:hypothetical protein